MRATQEYNQILMKLMSERDKMEPIFFEQNNIARENIERLSARSSFCQKLAIGFSVAMIIFTAGFFGRIISFFKGLFGLLPTVYFGK